MKKVATLMFALVTIGSAGSASAGEALLIRHEVLTVPVGTELQLRPGFFIGQAWTADGSVAETTKSVDQRQVRLRATAPGRTIVAAHNLRAPDQRVEFEVVVVASAEEVVPFTPAAPVEETSVHPEAESEAGQDPEPVQNADEAG